MHKNENKTTNKVLEKPTFKLCSMPYIIYRCKYNIKEKIN